MRLSPAAVDHICRLSPAQHGMLLEIASRGDRGLHYEQAFCALPIAPPPARLREAWEWLAARHSALRTSFHWRGLTHPVQVVHERAVSVLRELDWQGLEPGVVRDELRRWLAQEQAAGVELEQPPLLRLTLIRAPQCAWFVLGIHHLIHDAWSLDVLMGELWAYLEGQPDRLPARPYADYVRFLEQADFSEATAFWQRHLAGWSEGFSTLVPRETAPRDAECLIEEASLDEPCVTSLLRALRRRSLSPHTAVLAAWATVLAAASGRRQVCFGSTVAGRPAELAGSERMVGLFINVIPRRVVVPTHGRVDEWLAAVQQAEIAAKPFELLPTGQILRTIGTAREAQPIGTVVVMLNAFQEDGPAARGLGAVGIGSFGRSAVPVTLRVTPGPRMRLELLSPGCLSRERMRSILRQVSTVLSSLSDRMEVNVNTLTDSAADDIPETSAAPRAAWRSVRPTALNREPTEVVEVTVPAAPLAYPVVLTAKRADIALNVWAMSNREWLDTMVRRHRCVLVRGFPVLNAAEFGGLVAGLYPRVMEYKDRSTPRTALGGSIYTSTEYPAHQSIALHNEFSYATSWPQRVVFSCLQPANSGGETPLADSHLVYRAIPEDLRERFERHGVMYVRNYGVGADLTWEDAFQTKDQQEVSAYCTAHDIELEWLAGNRLRTRQIRRASISHPADGAPLWFNQAHLFHPSNLAPDVRAAMTHVFTPDELPRNACFGDGSPIPDADMECVREAYRGAAVMFPWQLGDVLLVDNMRIAHGRSPFTGRRTVIVGMSEPYAAPRMVRQEAWWQVS